MNNINTIKQNELAWDKKVENKSPWSIPVNIENLSKAKENILEITLTATKLVPRNWFPNNLKDLNILCLACGGGQQGPVLASTGAKVTVLDISSNQLKQDEKIAKKYNLDLKTIQRDMCDLLCFEDNSFDLIFCPVSVTYIPNVSKVYNECYRVLKKNGIFLFGSANPLIYLFNYEKYEEGIFEVSNKLPFNSLDELDEKEKEEFIINKEAIEYSHTLEDLIGGQTKVGFSIEGFYEDIDEDKICNYTPKYFAIKSVK